MKDFPVDMMKYLPEDFRDLKKGISHVVIINHMKEGDSENPDRAQMELQSPDEMHSELPRHPMDSMFEGDESKPDETLEAEPQDIQDQEDDQMQEESILNRLGKNPQANKMTRFSLKNTGPSMPRMSNMMSKGKKGRY